MWSAKEMVADIVNLPPCRHGYPVYTCLHVDCLPKYILARQRKALEAVAHEVESQGFYRDESGEKAAEIIRAFIPKEAP